MSLYPFEKYSSMIKKVDSLLNVTGSGDEGK